MMIPQYTIRNVLFILVQLIVLCGIVSGAAVTPGITYQGKLTNAAGSPLTGTYSVTFRLYDASTGGTTLSADTHSVTATNGLFTTSVAITDPTVMDGRALWLGIKVGADAEMTPRQEIRPVPYALSLRPGALVQDGSFTSSTAGTSWSTIHPGINVSTQYNYNPAIRFNTSGSLSYGIFGNTRGPNSYGAALSTEGLNSYGILSNTKGSGSPGVYAYTAGSSSPAIWGESAQDVAVKGIGKTGGYFSTNAGGSDLNNPAPAVNVSTAFEYNPGMRITTYGGASEGIFVQTNGQNSQGIKIGTLSDTAYAVDVETHGPNSIAVDAVTLGQNSPGIRSYTFGPNSRGLYVLTQGDTSPGIFATTIKDGSPGIAARTEGDTAYAVDVETHGPNSIAVDAATLGQNSPGLRSFTYGEGSWAIHAQTEGSNTRGLYVLTKNETSPGMVTHTYRDNSEGVYSVTNGIFSHGVYVQATGAYSQGVNASSAQATAIWADTGRADHMYGVQTPDYIRAARYDTGSSDVAEYWPVTGDVTPGTVLVLGDRGILHESTRAYDTRVAGIVSTEPGMSLGTREGGNPGEQLIALAGRVPCRVDASSAPIRSGDLLTTSDNPGHAMKATDPKIGTVLGKAAGSLESGTGIIEVLVTLQ